MTVFGVLHLPISFELFNLLEGLFWVGLGIISLILWFHIPNKYKRLSLFALTVFVLFGISDFIEIRTGMFWSPWWLLVMNVVSVLGLIVLPIWYIRLRIHY